MPIPNQLPNFKLGITMAGAVSAGAYTAGFMDYLLEVLYLWEQQKKRIKEKKLNGEALTQQEKKIPLYDVTIEAFGGASAGGMVGVMSALSLYEGVNPVTKKTDQRVEKNILYNSWVFLNDDLQNGKTTFEKMLDTSDLQQDTKGAISLLNSEPIDKIADDVFEKFNTSNQSNYEFPNFISKDLRVMLTLCNLRGVPYEVKFQHFGSEYFNYQPGHRMTEHMLIAHFKTNYNPEKDLNKYLNFNPFDKKEQELIKLCTKATGAFPVGLASRIFKEKITSEYVKNAFLRNLNISNSENIKIILPENWYDFTDVDGGTINNEPYDEVMQVLKEKSPNNDPKKPMIGVLMIDPFPGFYESDPNTPEETNKDFFQKYFIDVVIRLVSILINQVRVKRMGLLYQDDYRVLAFPYKWKSRGVKRNHPPLASSAIGGFGGFLDREFRKHDFFLGRRNAKNILNSYFSLKYDPNDLHPLFANLSPEMLDTFLNNRSKTFPIIPDINKILSNEENDHPYKYEYDDYPKLKKGYLAKIKKPLKNRLNKVIKAELKNRINTSWLWRTTIGIVRNIFIRKITNKLILKIEKIFDKRNQLEM